MRLFLLLLVLLNGVLFVMNATSKPPIQTAVLQNKQVPQLVLLQEKLTPVAATKPKMQPKKQHEEAQKPPVDSLAAILESLTLSKKNDETKEQANKPVEPIRQCYTAGPFENTDLLQQAAEILSNFGITYDQRDSVEKQYIGQLVYLPSHKTRQQVIEVANALAAKGVRDYMLLNEAGKSHALSLGVFSLKKNAEARIQTLAKLNYKAMSEPRYKTKTIHWLDYSIKDTNSQAALAAEQLQILNASQIERNCKS